MTTLWMPSGQRRADDCPAYSDPPAMALHDVEQKGHLMLSYAGSTKVRWSGLQSWPQRLTVRRLMERSRSSQVQILGLVDVQIGHVSMRSKLDSETVTPSWPASKSQDA